jgi:hypothetical protein
MSNAQQAMDNKKINSRWYGLYKVAGFSALITAALIVVQMVVYILWPPPSNASDYFQLFQDNALLGFLSLDLLYLIDNVLLIPVLLALYAALRKTNESAMLIGTALGFLGIAALFASNTSANMYYLSEQHAAAVSDAGRAALLAAGEAMLAVFSGSAYHISLIIGSVALVIIPAVMLQSNQFSKTTGYLGILANALALGFYVPVVGIFILLFSVLFLLAWYILVARRLLQMGQEKPEN